MTTTANASRYAPRGIDKAKPVSVRFLPDERMKIVDSAEAEGRSAGAFTRLMTLKGYALWEAEKKREAQGAVN